jgi:branched-chain amino acid transport system substrate-binding protein
MKKGKLVVALIVLAAAGVALAALTGRLGKPKLRLGVLLPFTGPDAAYGLGMRNSIRLAVDETNARGGVEGRKLELVEIDDASDPKKAQEAAERMVADPKMIAAVVNFDDECSLLSRVVFKDKLPTAVGGVINRSPLESGGDWEFRLIPDGWTLEIPSALYAWNTLGLRRFAWGNDETYFGKQVVRMFRAGLRGPAHRSIVDPAFRVARGTTDFKAAVDWALERNAEYVVYGGEPREAALYVKALRAGGYKGAFEAATHGLSQQFIEQAGPDAEGTLHTFAGLPPESFPEGKAYLDAYAAHHFAEPPTEFGILAYAEAQALISAMSQSLLTRASVAGAIKHEELATSLGKLRADYFASSYHQIAVYQVQRGRWVPIYTATDKDRPTAGD